MSDSTDSIEKEGTPKYSVPDDVEQEHEWRFRFQHDDDHQLWWLSISNLQALLQSWIMILIVDLPELPTTPELGNPGPTN